jgi:hypothetical protein
MNQAVDRPIVNWLELAVSTRWQKEGTVAALHPMGAEEGRPCFGVTLEERWLCGSSGALTFFDSIPAATRFLHLLSLDSLALADGCDRGLSARESLQCFRLGPSGLTACGKCRNDDEANA